MELRVAVLVAVWSITMPRMVLSIECVGTINEEETNEDPIRGLAWDTSHDVLSTLHPMNSITPSTTTHRPHVVEVAICSISVNWSIFHETTCHHHLHEM